MTELNCYASTSTDNLMISTSKQSIETLTDFIGFQRCEENAISFLTDLTLNLMFKVCTKTQLFTDHVGPRNTCAEDVLKTLEDFDITVLELNKYMCKTPSISPPISLPLFPVNIDRQKIDQKQITEKEQEFRKTNDIPDFLPQIWPSKPKSPPMQIVETPESLPKKCNSIIRPIKTTSSKYNLDSIDECFREYISFSLSKSNPYSSAQPASTSTIKSQTKSIKSSSSRGYSESPINGEKTIKMTSSKPQPTKRKVESNFIDNIKKSKTEKPNYSVSSSFVSSKATPNQFVSSLSIDCKKPQKGSPASSSEVKPRQKPSPQRSSLTPAFSNSSLVKKRYKNYISSSLPKSKPYYSPQPASASTIKNRTKSIQLSSSRGYSESPRPISGGKTIRMTPLRPQQRCTSFKTRSPANGFPRCELLTDNGIKMIIRFPKKV